MSEFIAPEGRRTLVKVIGREDPGEVLADSKTFGGRTLHLEAVAVRFPLDGLCAYYDPEKLESWDGRTQQPS
ncbi:hypothetical protein GCM10027038_09990 [Arthrobacter bambusae]